MTPDWEGRPLKNSEKVVQKTVPGSRALPLRPLIRAFFENLTGQGPDGKKMGGVFLPSESTTFVGSLYHAGFCTFWPAQVFFLFFLRRKSEKSVFF